MAIALLPEILVAFVLLLLAFAAVQLFRPLLVAVLSQMPIVGVWVAVRVNGLLVAITAIMAGEINAASGIITNLITAVFNDVWGNRVWTGYALEHAWSAINFIANVLIPVKMAEQAAYTTMVWVNTSAHTDAVWAGVTAHTDFVWKVTGEHTDFVWAASTAYTSAVWKAATDHADFVWRESTAFTQRSVSDLAAHVDYVWTTTAGYAEALTGQEMRRALDAERQLAIDIAVVGAGAIGTVENLWQQETSRARGAEGAIATAGAAAVAAVAARVAEIEDSPCQRYCGPLGELGQLLQGLADVALPALLVALAEEAIQHPADVASMVDRTIRPAAGAVYNGMQLGIPAA